MVEVVLVSGTLMLATALEFSAAVVCCPTAVLLAEVSRLFFSVERSEASVVVRRHRLTEAPTARWLLLSDSEKIK